MYDFAHDLRQSQLDNKWFHDFYKRHWPECEIETITDIAEQKTGIDSRIHLIDTEIPIEEKLRKPNSRYSHGYDMVLETHSNYEKDIPGWIVKPQAAKILAYGWEQLDQCILLHYGGLKKRYFENSERWENYMQPIYVQNIGYKTRSLIIPLHEILPYVKHIWYAK